MWRLLVVLVIGWGFGNRWYSSNFDERHKSHFKVKLTLQVATLFCSIRTAVFSPHGGHRSIKLFSVLDFQHVWRLPVLVVLARSADHRSPYRDANVPLPPLQPPPRPAAPAFATNGFNDPFRPTSSSSGGGGGGSAAAWGASDPFGGWDAPAAAPVAEPSPAHADPFGAEPFAAPAAAPARPPSVTPDLPPKPAGKVGDRARVVCVEGREGGDRVKVRVTSGYSSV